MDYVVLMIAGSALLAGAVAYGVTHRDFHAGGRAAAALACALLVGAASLYIPYLPVLALLGTAIIYLIVRRVFSAGTALAAAGLVLVAGCSFSVLLMMAALQTM